MYGYKYGYEYTCTIHPDEFDKKGHEFSTLSTTKPIKHRSCLTILQAVSGGIGVIFPQFWVDFEPSTSLMVLLSDFLSCCNGQSTYPFLLKAY